MEMDLITEGSGLIIWQLFGAVFLGYITYLVIRFLRSQGRKNA